MRYILDDSGYIHSVSCTPFNCNDKSCTEYTGAIPSGYETLAEWAQNANIRAYKLVGGNLTFDAAKDAELTAKWNAQDNHIIVTSTNVSPGEEWELFDKEFATKFIKDAFEINTTNTTSAEIVISRAGHNIDITGSFVNKVKLTDSAITIGSFDMEKLGVTLFGWSRKPNGWTDGGNSVLYLDLSNDGTLTSRDINYSLTSVAAGETWQFSVNVTISHLEYMLDEACDKFYWKRKAVTV